MTEVSSLVMQSKKILISGDQQFSSVTSFSLVFLGIPTACRSEYSTANSDAVSHRFRVAINGRTIKRISEPLFDLGNWRIRDRLKANANKQIYPSDLA